MQLAGLLLKAFQLPLGTLQLPGGLLQLASQLLVREFQLGVLSPGLMLVSMQGRTLAFQLERRGWGRGETAPMAGCPAGLTCLFSAQWAGALLLPLTALQRLCPTP